MRFAFRPPEALLDAVATGSIASRGDFEAYHNRLADAVSRASTDLLFTAAFPTIALHPHQTRAVRRVVDDLAGRAILADEVGLGKTVEAGAIIAEYMLRGGVERALILVPPSLVEQWSDELAGRFGFDLSIPRGEQGWREPVVLASLDTVKRERFAKVVRALSWDIVVVDEAHRLRNAATAAWRFVNSIRTRFFLLLTATPIHNDLRELYSLVTLVRPGLLSTYGHFKSAFVESPRCARDLPELRERLGRVLVRTNRREALLTLPARRATIIPVELSAPEREFYDGVVSLMRAAVSRLTARKQLLSYVVLLKEAASSAKAAVATLGRMCGRRERGSREWTAMKALIELGRQIRDAAKVRSLIEAVGHHEKTIVFTEFRGSQAVIAEELRRRGIPVAEFHGAMSPAERTGAVDHFRAGARVLVSTEAGGEGHNWQFCSRVVNFDLPWNPMRVEQRIGRVHRLGQDHDVEVVNLASVGTIEEHVCDLLTRKIRLFEAVLGDLDLILARTAGRGIETVLTDLVLSAGDDAALAAGLDELSEVVLRSREEYGRIQEWNDELFADGPEVMV